MGDCFFSPQGSADDHALAAIIGTTCARSRKTKFTQWTQTGLAAVQNPKIGGSPRLRSAKRTFLLSYLRKAAVGANGV
jgi:hypothetical protein